MNICLFIYLFIKQRRFTVVFFFFNKKERVLYTTVIMNETLHDRSSVTSDVGDIESSQNENQLDDQRFQFIFNYLNLVYGITPVVFQKGSFFFFITVVLFLINMFSLCM